MNPELNNLDGKQNALLILVGPPASGKSTWGKEFASANGVVYVSTDSIRAEIGKGESDQSVSGAAFAVARNRVTRALSTGKNVMIDATSVDTKARKDWIGLGRQFNAYIIAVAFEVPKEELFRRNAQRERHVPEEIIEKFVARYQRPTVNEVDKVIVK